LLKPSIKKLPAHRRRRVVSLTEVEWFEPALATAIRLLKAESAEKDQHVPLLQEGVETYKTLNEEVAAFNARYLKLKEENLKTVTVLTDAATATWGEHKEWRVEDADALHHIHEDQCTIHGLLRGILRELSMIRRLAVGMSVLLTPMPPADPGQTANGPMAVTECAMEDGDEGGEGPENRAPT
jgi:hypothetical protein